MILKHCEKVPLPDPGPCVVTVTTTDGPGDVDVVAVGGGVLDSVPVPPGGSMSISHMGPLQIHYRKADGGPDEIVATVTQT